MATIEEKEITQLVNQISELKTSIEEKGNDGRAKLAAIPVDTGCSVVRNATDGTYISGSWSGITDEKTSTDLHLRLIQLRDSLYSALGQDGPRQPTHIMYFEYASNSFIILWTLVGLLLLTLLLGQIRKHWDTATNTNYIVMIEAALAALDDFVTSESEFRKSQSEAGSKLLQATSEKDPAKRADMEKQAQDLSNKSEVQKDQKLTGAREKLDKIKREKSGATEGDVIEMVALLGALGGSLHFLGSIVGYVGNRRLRRSWLLYYLSLPLVGAALAPIIYMLLRVGILTPTGQGNGGTTISNLNLIAIYGFSALTGMFAKTASEKLGDVFAAIFPPKPDRETGDKIAPAEDSLASGTGIGKGP